MVLGMNSFNMFNTTGTFGMSNMFGMGGSFGGCGLLGSGFGGSIFGGGFGTSLFTDCNGYTNYDAMAGFAIGNQLMNIAGMGASYGLSQIGSGKREREDVASDLQNRLDKSIDKISKQLTNLNLNSDPATITKESLSDTAEIKTDALKNAETALKTANDELDELNKKLDTGGEFATDEKKYPKIENSNPVQYDKTKFTAEYDRFLDQVDAAEKKVTDAEAKIKTEEANRDELVNELKTLIDDRIKIQKEINDAILDFADGDRKCQRNRDLELGNYKLGSNGEKVKTTSKKDIAQLIYLFRNTDDVEQKRNYALAIDNIDNAAF